MGWHTVQTMLLQQPTDHSKMRKIGEPNNPRTSRRCWCTTEPGFGEISSTWLLFIPQAGQESGCRERGGRIMQREESTVMLEKGMRNNKKFKKTRETTEINPPHVHVSSSSLNITKQLPTQSCCQQVAPPPQICFHTSPSLREASAVRLHHH